jgi:PadR family transcriptional regulator AphA
VVARKAVPLTAPDEHLTLAEWAVLGVLGAGPRHAFAIVKTLAGGGEFGRIWAVPTPVVDRWVNTLRDEGLLEVLGEERSDAGPPRTLLSITRAGKRRLESWPSTPVTHMRDVRSELLLKRAFWPACAARRRPWS